MTAVKQGSWSSSTISGYSGVWNGPGWTYPYNSTYVSSTSRGFRNPAKQAVKGVKRLPPLPYQVWEITTKSHLADWTGHDTSQQSQGSGTWPELHAEDFNIPYWEAFREISETAKSRCIMKLQSEVKSQNVNYSVALAEASATARLIGDSLLRIGRALSAVRRLDIPSACRHLSVQVPRNYRNKLEKYGPHGWWLELQYGWLPLASDVHGAEEDLRRFLVSQPILAVAKASVKVPIDRTYDITSDEHHIRYKLRETGYTRSRASVTYVVSDELKRLASMTGVSDPLSVAWELVPFSFVLDWALPVGNYLSNLTYDNGLQFLSGYISQKDELRLHTTQDGPSHFQSGSTFMTFENSSYDWRAKGFLREVWSEFPRPEPPRLKDPFSATHVANALSLIASIFQSRR